MKTAEVEQQITHEQERLTRIEARLKQIDKENIMPTNDVVLKTIPPTLIASRRVTIPTNNQTPNILGAAFTEVYDHLKQRGAKDIGPCLAVWHQAADVYDNEDAVPIDRRLPGTDRVKVYELPLTQVASI